MSQTLVFKNKMLFQIKTRSEKKFAEKQNCRQNRRQNRRHLPRNNRRKSDGQCEDV